MGSCTMAEPEQTQTQEETGADCVGSRGDGVGPLLPLMTGNFQLDSTENFDEFMRELGVNWFTRNIGNNLYPVQRIWQDQGEIHIDTETSFRSTQTNFKLDQTWQETTADGRVTETVATMDGRVLTKVQVPEPSTGYHTTHEDLCELEMWGSVYESIRACNIGSATSLR